MHIAFDGGCFQQGILAGIYQVACGFLNAAKQVRPDLQVTLVCDSRLGIARPEALSILNLVPAIVYGALSNSYDAPESWPATRDPFVRFLVDGRIVPAGLREQCAVYEGTAPKRAFAILSRTAAGQDNQLRRGIKINEILLKSEDRTIRLKGNDRRLRVGFSDDCHAERWTDGAGFLPLACFPEDATSVVVEVKYIALERYPMRHGGGAEAVLEARRLRRDIERYRSLAAIARRLRDAGCVAYIANHFTPINLPGLVNLAWAYDLIPVLLPQYFNADAQLNFQENLRVFAKADRVYAISDCTRDDLIRCASVPPSQAITAGIAPSAGFWPRDAESVRSVLSGLGLQPDGYILAVATIEPRKNHLRLLQAYLKLRSMLPDCPNLVLVGKMGWDFQQVLSFRSENGLEGAVKMLSDRSEDDLACLYSGALFSAYLSVYEGFGLPIVEAMACGCPVLTSNLSSMPEVAGEAALLVDPYDIEAVSSALLEMCTSERLRSGLAVRGRLRALDYTWSRSARVVMDDLERLVARA
jgi:glycosyltransferase involved in cell wall biosynthesis